MNALQCLTGKVDNNNNSSELGQQLLSAEEELSQQLSVTGQPKRQVIYCLNMQG